MINCKLPSVSFTSESRGFVNTPSLKERQSLYTKDIIITSWLQDRLYKVLSCAFPIAECSPLSSMEKGSFSPYIPQTDLTTYSLDPVLITPIARILRYLENPQEWKKRGITPPKGIILCGPPGTGKTKLAEKIAGHMQVPLFQISAAEMLNPFVGGTEALLRTLFQQAKEKAPCIVFIDEFDTLGTSRSSPGVSSYKPDMVNQLLTLLSNDTDGIIVVAATNSKKDRLDAALIRPGRFDAVISLTLPNEEQIMQILSIQTKEKTVDSSVSLAELAKRCKGFSGADLTLLVNEAALRALENGRDKINRQDMEEARQVVKTGFAVSSKNIEQRKIVAGHEAGHAIVAEKLGFPVTLVSIKGDGSLGAEGKTEFDTGRDVLSKSQMTHLLSVYLGGRAAEKVFFQNEYATSSLDIQMAKELVNNLRLEGMIDAKVSVDSLLQEALKKATGILEDNQDLWRRIQTALIEKEYLDREDFMQVVNPEASSIPQRIWSIWSPNNAKTTQDFILPPPKPKQKDTSLEKSSTTSLEEIKSNAIREDGKHPILTKENIANALGINDVREIRRVEKSVFDRIEIKLKVGFDKKQLDKIKQVLLKNRIEHYVDTWSEEYGYKIEIYKDDAEDFIAFVERESKLCK